MLGTQALPHTLWQLPDIRTDHLRVVLADSTKLVEQAQSLRYDVFVGEIGAKASREVMRRQRDFDDFDAVCDHLLVIDDAVAPGKNPVVGTYRLIRGTAAGRLGRFYSQSEYDVARIAAFNDDILELGRSCIRKEYRNTATLQMLWRGIGAYVAHYNVQMMFGCASFPGTQLEPIKKHLSYLYHHHLAPEAIRAKALAEQYISMNWCSAEESKDRAVRATLPPLIKGYLGVGGFIGDGAVYDYVCNTIDVAIIVQTERLKQNYQRRYVHE